jgi:hypothetical protein
MDCGRPLGSQTLEREMGQSAVTYQRQDEGTDWAELIAAILAFLSLRRMSRRARGSVFVVVFLALFFGCPMVCGFAMFVVDSISKLFQ